MNEKEIKNIFSNNDLDSIAINLKELIDSFRMTNNVENKKSLKLFFNFILQHLNDTIAVNESYNFVKIMSMNIYALSALFPEILNEYIKLLLKELEQLVFKNFDSFLNNSLDVKKIINSSLLIISLTNNLNQPNQMITNYIMIINSFLDKVSIDKKEEKCDLNILIKFYFIGVLSILSENTASYNPNLFNQIDHLINEIKIKIISQEKKTEELQVLNTINELLNNNNPSVCFNSLYLKLLIILKNLMRLYKDEINFEIIFKNIIVKILEINENFLIYKKEEFKCVISSGHDLIETYEEFRFVNNSKKSIEINFMKVKKKELCSLDPEIDGAFMGRSYITPTASTQKVAKAIQKKIKSTRKQAIRNLKKESKVIDVQRQKKNSLIVEKKREDQRLSNQFIEQQNIEYKKLVTSQPKKRFKLKQNKNTRE